VASDKPKAELVKIHVKKGDTVVVITGKDAGVRGKILEVDRKKGRVVVEKANMVKKHTKPSKTNPQGGIISKEAPINSSNVMYYCQDCKSAARIGKKVTDNGKDRVCKKCGVVLPDKK